MKKELTGVPREMHPAALDRYSQMFHGEATKEQKKSGMKKTSPMSSAHFDPATGTVSMSTTNRGSQEKKPALTGPYKETQDHLKQPKKNAPSHCQNGRCAEGGTTGNWPKDSTGKTAHSQGKQMSSAYGQAVHRPGAEADPKKHQPKDGTVGWHPGCSGSSGTFGCSDVLKHHGVTDTHHRSPATQEMHHNKANLLKSGTVKEMAKGKFGEQLGKHFGGKMAGQPAAPPGRISLKEQIAKNKAATAAKKSAAEGKGKAPASPVAAKTEAAKASKPKADRPKPPKPAEKPAVKSASKPPAASTSTSRGAGSKTATKTKRDVEELFRRDVMDFVLRRREAEAEARAEAVEEEIWGNLSARDEDFLWEGVTAY